MVLAAKDVTVSLFISYTRVDEALVRELSDDLKRLGRTVWMDHQIHGGESWWREILNEIQSAVIFVFALSNHSWRSEPCRRELEYAEKLGIPVLPVQVGPLDSMFIPLAEKQIIDYRGRSADAVVRLVGALGELTARPIVLPNPLPAPPDVPFEYLYRIASVMGPNKISPDRQEELVGKLRRKLKEEKDEVARADIVQLLKELRDRRELTIQNAGEIDEILAIIESQHLPELDDGATRLPPADHWRRAMSDSAEHAVEPERSPEPEGASQPDPPERTEKNHAPEAVVQTPEPVATGPVPEPPPGESGEVPGWLRDIVRLGGDEGRPMTGQAVATTATAQWWGHGPAARAETPTAWVPYPVPPVAPQAQRSGRFALVGGLLGAIGVCAVLLLLGIGEFALRSGVVTTLLIATGLGLSMSIVSAARREPRSRIAVILAVVGLLGMIFYAVGIAF